MEQIVEGTKRKRVELLDVGLAFVNSAWANSK